FYILKCNTLLRCHYYKSYCKTSKRCTNQLLNRVWCFICATKCFWLICIVRGKVTNLNLIFHPTFPVYFRFPISHFIFRIFFYRFYCFLNSCKINSIHLLFPPSHSLTSL